jgi:uncharacterized cupredoxin-like copper-binding protein
MKKHLVVQLAMLLSLSMVLLASCGGPAGPTEVQAKLSEFKIELDKTSIPAGPVTFNITNEGAITHELVLEPAGARDEPFEKDGKVSEAEDIEPGDSTTLEWTIDEPGEYQLACYIEGHFEAGMHTTFTVTSK